MLTRYGKAKDQGSESMANMMDSLFNLSHRACKSSGLFLAPTKKDRQFADKFKAFTHMFIYLHATSLADKAYIAFFVSCLSVGILKLLTWMHMRCFHESSKKSWPVLGFHGLVNFHQWQVAYRHLI